jgi:methylthioribulose-1-phosphate dehydratase
MNPADYPADMQKLKEICHLFGDRGWCRATSGNFSSRIDDSHCLITRSGRDKSRLKDEDLMVCTLDGRAVDPTQHPSAETPVHTSLYRLDDSIGAVLHTHSVNATLLSLQNDGALTIRGYEMQKALAGVTSHEQASVVPIFANDQDMVALGGRIVAAWSAGQIAVPGFLIAGHGLYAWGRDLAEAQRHTEGFEFLFECLLLQGLAIRS